MKAWLNVYAIIFLYDIQLQERHFGSLDFLITHLYNKDEIAFLVVV